ncbi:MAG: hypothetical protein LBD29_08025 [Treponema sp.]|nr:hypothetical protein [Treponema sp.]
MRRGEVTSMDTAALAVSKDSETAVENPLRKDRKKREGSRNPWGASLARVPSPKSRRLGRGS